VLVYSLKGTQNIKNYVLPFYSKYIVEYSSKYKSEMFESYCYIIDKLDSNKKRTMEKEILIELVKLLYLFNPDGKGKQRKRTLEEVLEIINGKR
jgi:phage anti-repressor protein